MESGQLPTARIKEVYRTTIFKLIQTCLSRTPKHTLFRLDIYELKHMLKRVARETLSQAFKLNCLKLERQKSYFGLYKLKTNMSNIKQITLGHYVRRLLIKTLK